MSQQLRQQKQMRRNKMAKYVYGIDLGTTYSCIAYVDESGRATVINNSDGTNTTPSVVNFASPTNVVVGQVAKEGAVIDPENTVVLVKTSMGKTDFAISYNGEDKSPEEVSAYILRKVTADAAEMINEEVKDVVITCPAYFGTAERTATKNAGIIADLNVLEIISEPTAAAIYYGCTKEQENKTVMVYDLGGGTFDVTIMSISQDHIEVICSDGNHELGGKDWDEALMRYLSSEFVEQTGFDDDFDENAQQDLRLKAERAKQALSRKEEVSVTLDVAGLRAKINVSRDTFNEITAVLLNETIDKSDAAMAVAKGKGFTVDEILLVGGSTRMPQVPEILRQKYGMEPKFNDPDEAVAKGAAIHAVNVYINNQESLSKWEQGATSDQQAGSGADLETLIENKENYQEDLKANQSLMSIGGKMKEVIVATTKSFATDVLVDDKPMCNNLIIKNVAMPNGVLSSTGTYGTTCANQEKVKIEVYENDFMDDFFDVDRDYYLGEAILELPPNLPKGARVEVTFTLNSEGILAVTGRDVTSGKEVHATMQAKGIMDASKVGLLKEKSKAIVVS
jgi:molecular chaperone DnaK (HSP70)